jgi:hypothetical protein
LESAAPLGIPVGVQIQNKLYRAFPDITNAKVLWKSGGQNRPALLLFDYE